MLPEEPPLRDPLENPPPDPPRAFAKDRVGTPTRAITRHAAMSLVVFKLNSFLLTIKALDTCHHRTRNGRPRLRPLYLISLRRAQGGLRPVQYPDTMAHSQGIQPRSEHRKERHRRETGISSDRGG